MNKILGIVILILLAGALLYLFITGIPTIKNVLTTFVQSTANIFNVKN